MHIFVLLVSSIFYFCCMLILYMFFFLFRELLCLSVNHFYMPSIFYSVYCSYCHFHANFFYFFSFCLFTLIITIYTYYSQSYFPWSFSLFFAKKKVLKWQDFFYLQRSVHHLSVYLHFYLSFISIQSLFLYFSIFHPFFSILFSLSGLFICIYLSSRLSWFPFCIFFLFIF